MMNGNVSSSRAHLFFSAQKGFLLPVVAISLAIMSFVALKGARVEIQKNRVSAAIKMSKEVKIILSAARRYRQKQGSWPSSTDDLKNQGYLNASWPSLNPWGNPYVLTSSGPWLLNVSSTVPTDMKEYIEAVTPASKVSGGVFMASTLPDAVTIATSASHSDYVSKSGDATYRTMNDDLIMGGNTVTSLGSPSSANDLMPLDYANARYVRRSGDIITGNATAVYGRLRATRFGGINNGDDIINPSGWSEFRHSHRVYDMYVRNITKANGDNWLGHGSPLINP